MSNGQELTRRSVVTGYAIPVLPIGLRWGWMRSVWRHSSVMNALPPHESMSTSAQRNYANLWRTPAYKSVLVYESMKRPIFWWLKVCFKLLGALFISEWLRWNSQASRTTIPQVGWPLERRKNERYYSRDVRVTFWSSCLLVIKWRKVALLTPIIRW